MTTPRSITVTRTVQTTREIPVDVADHIADARRREQRGRELIAEAADMIREAAQELTRQAWSQREVAQALAVDGKPLSTQRVSQLLKPRAS